MIKLIGNFFTTGMSDSFEPASGTCYVCGGYVGFRRGENMKICTNTKRDGTTCGAQCTRYNTGAQ